MLWLPVIGYETFYEVSDDGRIRSLPRVVPCRSGTRRAGGNILRPTPDKDGYLIVSLSRGDGKQTSQRLHGLIMRSFVGPRPVDMETRHLDGDPANGRLSNLKYGTGKENWADRRKHGRGIDGERNPHAIIRRRNEIC